MTISKYHFNDILLSGNEKYYSHDLDALSYITKNVEMLENSSENPFRIIENTDIKEEFNKYKNEKQKEIYNVPKDLISYFENWEPDDIIKSIKPKIINYLHNIIPSENDLVLGLFGIFREELKMLKEMNVRFPYISREQRYVKNIQHLVVVQFNESDFSYTKISDVFKNLKNFIHVTEFTADMIWLYCLAELLGIAVEKDKSTNKNILNDIHHINFGLHGHIFVTEDKRLRIKAQFIRNWLNLKARIFSIDEFIKAYAIQNSIQDIKCVEGINKTFHFNNMKEAQDAFKESLMDPNNDVLYQMLIKKIN